MKTHCRYLTSVFRYGSTIPAYVLDFAATSPEEALTLSKAWISKNTDLSDCRIQIRDFSTRKHLLEVESPLPRSKKIFYTTIYHLDGSFFGVFEQKAETPEEALSKVKTYVAKVCKSPELYSAVVRERGSSDVLLDRIFLSKTSEDFISDWLYSSYPEVEAKNLFDEAEASGYLQTANELLECSKRLSALAAKTIAKQNL